MATIDAHYFRVCTGGARRQGVDVERLLRSAGIDPGAPGQPGWRGDAGAMARLVRGIVAVLDDEQMGFTAGPLAPGAFAFAAELAAEGATVLDGLRRATRFYNLASRAIGTRLVRTEHEVSITARFAEPDRDPDRYFHEFWLMTWHRLACWLAGDTVALLGAAFDYGRPSGYLDEFRRLFPCPQRFEAGECRIVMDARALDAPIHRTRAELEAMVATAPLDIMTIPASDRSLARRVRLALSREPALAGDAVAAALSLRPETLRKRLRREGTSLSAVREGWRRDAAIRDLVRTTRSVDSIAARIGFAEARSFTRAFRAWTGQSPSAYRQMHRVPR